MSCQSVRVREWEGDSATFGQWKSIIHALGHAAEKYARHATTQPPPESMQQFLQLPTDNSEAPTLHLPLHSISHFLSPFLPLSLILSLALSFTVWAFVCVWFAPTVIKGQLAWAGTGSALRMQGGVASKLPPTCNVVQMKFNTKAAKSDKKKQPKWKGKVNNKNLLQLLKVVNDYIHILYRHCLLYYYIISTSLLL